MKKRSNSYKMPLKRKILKNSEKQNRALEKFKYSALVGIAKESRGQVDINESREATSSKFKFVVFNILLFGKSTLFKLALGTLPLIFGLLFFTSQLRFCKQSRKISTFAPSENF